MSDKTRRLQSIELALKPRQLVLLWLSKAQQAGDFEHGALQSPPPRGVLANAVLNSVRKAMKGQPESLIEQAVQQARQEADQLYILAVDTNVRILETRNARKREVLLVLAHFLTALQVPVKPISMEYLRSSLVVLVEEVVLTAETTKRIAAEYFDGQNVLFSDARGELEDQIQTMVKVCAAFNSLAAHLGQPPLDLRRIREDLESRIEEQVSTAAEIALGDTLGLFGDEASRVSAMVEFARKHAQHPDPNSDDVDCEQTEGNPELRRLLAELAQQARTQLELGAIV
ncbi:MAG: hypothetical protein ABSE40_20315 [Candidatus Sulfotelmatobacter sp.]|jgi:hypothetical protein